MADKYTMSLDMRVLQHLGLRLYSNVAAVISELVANSWDAEATKVSITFNVSNGMIVVNDNGGGMTVDEINRRFLTVGYEKRAQEGDESPNLKRRFMGRKGIGKLSTLSIAEEVEIYSSKDGEHNALRIRMDALEAAIKRGDLYHPEEIPFGEEYPKSGTTIVLRRLVKKRFAISVAALRKRVARRFSIIGHRGTIAGDTFEVIVDGKSIDQNDRDDLKAIEYLWEFGKAEIDEKSVPNLHVRFLIDKNEIPGHPDWMVKGWFGTARKPADLEQADPGSMRNIVVLARGRLIQESILDKLGFNRIFGSYVTGLIEADFLDLKDEDDIATSDRQRLIEDDPRVIALRDFMRQQLVEASEIWGTVRRAKKAKDAECEHPGLKKWIDGLPEGQRPAAESMLGLIGELQVEEEEDRKHLYRSGVLAFERLRLQDVAHRLERLESLDAEKLLPLLVLQDHFESALYGEIVRTRIEAIKQFQNLTDAKAKETVLQTHLYSHLWLLDAGWERVEDSETIEHRLQRDYPKEFAKELTQDEKLGRVDIRYRVSSGTHIIVELKKYERHVNVDDLEAQGRKYRSAMVKLAKQNGEHDPRVEVAFVLGQPPKVDSDAGLDQDYVTKKLGNIHARVFYYDQLIGNALKAYGDYLKAHQKADSIDRLLEEIVEPSRTESPVPLVSPAGTPAGRKVAGYPAKKRNKHGRRGGPRRR